MPTQQSKTFYDMKFKKSGKSLASWFLYETLLKVKIIALTSHLFHELCLSELLVNFHFPNHTLFILLVVAATVTNVSSCMSPSNSQGPTPMHLVLRLDHISSSQIFSSRSPTLLVLVFKIVVQQMELPILADLSSPMYSRCILTKSS